MSACSGVSTSPSKALTQAETRLLKASINLKDSIARTTSPNWKRSLAPVTFISRIPLSVKFSAKPPQDTSSSLILCTNGEPWSLWAASHLQEESKTLRCTRALSRSQSRSMLVIALTGEAVLVQGQLPRRRAPLYHSWLSQATSNTVAHCYSARCKVAYQRSWWQAVV